MALRVGGGQGRNLKKKNRRNDEEGDGENALDINADDINGSAGTRGEQSHAFGIY